MVVVDMEGVVAGFEILPDATVDARLVKVTARPGKANPQNQVYKLELVINEGAGEPWAGRKAFITLPTTAEGLGITKKALIDLGMDPDELNGKVDLTEAFGALIGADARVRITTEQYRGNDTNNYKIVSADDWSS